MEAYPYEIKDMENKEELAKVFTKTDVVCVGPKKYLKTKLEGYREFLYDLYNMEVRPTDVFVITIPRSGTTFTQELVWLIANDLDFETAKNKYLYQRYREFMQQSKSAIERLKDQDVKDVINLELLRKPFLEALSSLPDPRFFKSHYPLSLLNPDTLRTSKVVYVARNPLDVAVSTYHLGRSTNVFKKDVDFKTYWNFFRNGFLIHSPYFEHVKEAWELRNHPNMLFLFYENLVKDLRTEIYKICNFFNKSYSEEQIDELCKHLQFNNFKKNKSVNGQAICKVVYPNEEIDFIRKGKVGGWRDYFDDAMCRDARQWLQQNLEGTTLTYTLE